MNTTEDFLPIIDPDTGEIRSIASQEEVRRKWLPYGQVDLWVPGTTPNQVIIQVKTDTHGKRIATAGGHISWNKDTVHEIIGRNILELAPETVMQKWRRETGLVFTAENIEHVWTLTQSFAQPSPVNSLWQNWSRFIYFLPKKINLDEILKNPNKKRGTDFLEVSIDELLALKKWQTRYKTRFEHDTYQQILRGIQKRIAML